MRSKLRCLVLGAFAASNIVACSGDDTSGGGPPSSQPDAAVAVDSGGSTKDAASPSPDAGSDAPSDAPSAAANAVYTMTNAAAGNDVVGFLRASDGSLTPMATPFPTDGKASGSALGEQGAVALDGANDRLYVVNAGDASFSIFPVQPDGSLGAAVRVAAGAGLVGPKSITFHGSIVYVLFEGDAHTPSMIAGWTVTASGATPIAGSTLALSSDTKSVDPAQIQLTPDGKQLVVTEKGTNTIDTFAVDASGVATKVGFFPTAKAGADAGLQGVPYGFAFVGDTLVVSEAGSTGVGTYTFANGMIAPVTGATQFLPTDAAPCWVAASANWAYVANARGPNISGFTVAANGGLTNVGSAANAVVATTGTKIVTDAGTMIQGPTDEAVSADGKFLYVLDAAVPAIGIFQVNGDGTLTRVGSGDYTAAALPAGAVGIAAR